MGKKPGWMGLEEGQARQAGGEAAHQQVGGRSRKSSIGREPGLRSKEELDLAISKTKYGVLVIEEMVIEGRLQVHFGNFNIHRWVHWVWAFTAAERS